VKAAQPSRLVPLGVYGFDAVEPVVLAARVTEDPLPLIGASGTGKTYELNSLSEAFGPSLPPHSSGPARKGRYAATVVSGEVPSDRVLTTRLSAHAIGRNRPDQQRVMVSNRRRRAGWGTGRRRLSNQRFDSASTESLPTLDAPRNPAHDGARQRLVDHHLLLSTQAKDVLRGVAGEQRGGVRLGTELVATEDQPL